VKGRAYADKLLVLSPRRDDSYQILSLLLEYADDVGGLKALAARAAKADLDVGDDEVRYRDFLAGKDDAKKLEETKAHVTRTREALTAARPLGGVTFSVAAGRYVRAKAGGVVPGSGRRPRRAGEAGGRGARRGPVRRDRGGAPGGADVPRAPGSDESRRGLLGDGDQNARSFGTTLVVYALTVNGPHRAKLVANADVRRLGTLAEESFRRDPGPRARERVGVAECARGAAGAGGRGEGAGERAGGGAARAGPGDGSVRGRDALDGVLAPRADRQAGGRRQGDEGAGREGRPGAVSGAPGNADVGPASGRLGRRRPSYRKDSK
jgi:hypothetical protein